MNINNMRVSSRLAIGFGLVLSFLVIVLSLSIHRMAQMQERMNEIVNVNDVQSKLASTMYLTIIERALALRNLILLRDESMCRSRVVFEAATFQCF